MPLSLTDAFQEAAQGPHPPERQTPLTAASCVCVWVSIPAANPALNETLYSRVLTLFIMALFPLWHLIDRYNGFYRLFISLLQQWINTTSSHA